MAKARMLSFDFLSDERVYNLPTPQVLILAGMVARADNLGRLPGEPTVLLPYLFLPRPPRQDLTPEMVLALLASISTGTHPMVDWYAVEGVRFTQFRNWDKHQPGIRPHNRKSDLPAPPGGVPSNECAFGTPVIDTGGLVHALVQSVTAQMGDQRASLGFDQEVIAHWVDQVPGRRSFLTATNWFMAAKWLHNTGTTAVGDILILLTHCYEKKPDNLFAYLRSLDMRAKIILTARGAQNEVESEHRRVGLANERAVK